MHLTIERKRNRRDAEAVNCVDLSSLMASGGRISRTRQSREEGDLRHSHRRSGMTSYTLPLEPRGPVKGHQGLTSRGLQPPRLLAGQRE